ncbi:4'-phosphopantetheinyl transferase family protein [uncultured Fibrella sp.]|uniref:4'-phosphopantetheinyl transferase family protein n=1 Tax=uncultured Fibrella sp. TaxID=1284596 RepID=UPI0035CA66A9
MLVHASWERWSTGLEPPSLAVFRYRICPADQPWLYDLLLPDEQQRAARFRREADRHRFVAGRGWLRWLIGQFTHQSPTAIQLTTGPFGKPELLTTTTSGSNWHVNVSHAGEWVLLAVGPVPVGVDVEWINPDWPYQDLIASSFSAVDQAQLAASSTPRALFYTFWTRKESLLKATGQGLTNDLLAFSVSKEGDQCIHGLQTEASSWMIVSFTVTDGYVGSLACQKLPESSRFFTLAATSVSIDPPTTD